jgi:uncharacterized NAD(P)/FAD-binding protein YdhS
MVSTADRGGLSWLVSELDRHSSRLDKPTISRLLGEADLTLEEVAPFVEEREASYARRCVARRDNYELLVLTWLPSQGSVAHDHSGCLCGLKVVKGCLTEQLFEQGSDGQVRRTSKSQLKVGGITVDPGIVIHSLTNEAGSPEVLITVHIYAPPLPEVRRYAVASESPARVFVRAPSPAAQTVAIIGGGFTGAIALANLLRLERESELPLHIVLIDRQPAIGEGIAYRTNDGRHLLNVPVGRMSAWPDRPDDFLQFVQSKDPAAKGGDFVSRKLYGQYVRQSLLTLAESASNQLSVEIIRDEATRLTPISGDAWDIESAGGRKIRADLTILTIGHRPPDDPFGSRWAGPRNRFVADPWAALVLSQIGPKEPVLLLGSGLTAVDAILTLDRSDRVAPLITVSRRGLMPLPHAREARAAVDLSEVLRQWLDSSEPLTIQGMVDSLRRRVALGAQDGTDWRQIIDGLRLAISQLWGKLSSEQRARFLRHVRPFWEIHRHRMAPDVADTINKLRDKWTLEVVAGSVLSAKADAEGVDVAVACRGNSSVRNLRVSWVVNCTGPGVHNRHTTHPLLRPLLAQGIVCNDEFDLGLHTDPIGHAIDAEGKVLPTLLVAGTLRKSTLWESTAVPELRQQAQIIAKAALQSLTEIAARSAR